jgi:hypothetical protein
MATTTNYGWATPDDTDLVKDGAAAIRTLGTSIDTSFAADEGDLLVGGTSDIFEALPIGAAGTVLTSDGDTAEWAAPSAGSLTLLSTTNLSSNSVTISGISQDYLHLLLLITGINIPTASNTFIVKPNNATTYYSGVRTTSGTTTSYGNADGNITGVNIDWGTNNGSMAYYIYDYTNTSGANPPGIKAISFSGIFVPGAYASFVGGGGVQTTTAVTSISITTGGTFNAGRIRIYGVK